MPTWQELLAALLLVAGIGSATLVVIEAGRSLFERWPRAMLIFTIALICACEFSKRLR